MTHRRSLAQEWFDFDVRVVPKGAEEVQRTETRRAFYAGAQAIFGLMTTELDEDKEPTAADLAYVESLHTELRTFARDVRSGHA